MKIKALKTIVEFDNGQMVVINADEVGELSDAKAEAHIAAGAAKAVKAGAAKAVKDEAEPAPEASAPEEAPASDEAPA
jgi:hypothetical protein